MKTSRIEIPAESPLFAGHFPDRPILPGIAHLALVARALAGAAFLEVRSLRLRRPVGPGDLLALSLEEPDGSGMVRFALHRGEEAVSSGAVRPAPGGWGPVDPEPVFAEPGDFPPVPALVPHGLPARLVTGVVAADPEGIVCLAEIPPDHPLVEGGRAPTFLGLEACAQAAAVLEALGRREAPGPRLGYLVGIRDARFETPHLPVGRPLRAAVHLHGSAPPLSMYRATLAGAGGEVLAGTISTYLIDP